jgi:hypothetical protein
MCRVARSSLSPPPSDSMPPIRGSPVRSGFSAFCLRLLRASNVTYRFGLLLFGPSSPCAATTSASADSCLSFVRLAASLPLRETGRSPGVRRAPFAPRLPHLRPSVRMTIGLRCTEPTRPPSGRLYAVRIPQAGALLSASSPPHVAVTQLPFH